jgi:phage gp29-like protein
MPILDQHGHPIDRKVLGEPQTAQVQYLRSQYLQPMLGGLTPARIGAILQRADMGDLTAQHRLFADMEDRDAHLLAEINKRKLALLTLDWDIVPPRNASFQEKKSAQWLKEVLTDAVDPIEDLILALMDGPGHGFAAAELSWARWGAEWLPSFHPRPQEWFKLEPTRRDSLRLCDGTQPGAELQPFGWVLHTHGKPKTGYLGRMGLYRAVVWPFLYKFYSIADLAEFLEVYGLPIIVGKYFAGASEAEKSTLLQAVVDLGHDARAIMPQEMALEIQKITGSGDGAPHLAMIDWAERSQSKAILGQVLSAEAKATGMGSGTANLHGEVRHDILAADARQIGATLTRDLCYPLIAINRGIDSLQRCPRFVFDTGEPEDLKLFADALPKLSALKMRIPVAWAHEKLKIPLAEDGDEVLEVAQPTAAAAAALTPAPSPSGRGEKLAVMAVQASAQTIDPTPASALAEQLAREAAGAWRGVMAHIEQLVADADSLPALQQALLAAFDGLPLDDLRAVMASGFAVAQLAGLSEVVDEAAASTPGNAGN